MSARGPADLARDLDSLALRLSRAEGRRDALASRRAALEREVALAKGRLAAREGVETFLDEVQAEISRRNLARFETLLSALVQEVLPGEKPIALELSTERGLPALDICAVRPDGSREDVLEDNGGALTNVIGTALRLIAVVKAGVGRFLALDEADCWIAPDRIPAFYRVLQDGAARLGIQCLAISHHDLSAFGSDFRVSRITGDPQHGVGILSPDPDAGWDAEAAGFRHIRLVDVQGYRDATLTLGRGVNALVGPNNRGKSTVIRALRAVFYGEARDSLVRAGAASATVEIGVAKGRTLRFSRQPKRTPVNLWSLHEADGSVVEENGTRYETGGRAVPDWVERLFGIVKVEQLDVHVAHQKFPVFLLGEPASRRSAVLSIGQEAAYLRDMLAVHRERCVRDTATVRNGEKEIAEIGEALKRFETLSAVAHEVAAARGLAAAAEASEHRRDTLVRHLIELRDAAARLAGSQARATIFADLPAPDRLAALTARSAHARDLTRVGQAVPAARQALDKARNRLAALAGLPEALPAIADTRAAETAAARLADLSAGLAAARRRRKEAERAIAAVRAEVEAVVERAGGLCPTCGSAVDATSLLGGHVHAAGQDRRRA